MQIITLNSGIDNRHRAGNYGNTGCGVFKGGIQNKKGFCIKINIPKGNF